MSFFGDFFGGGKNPSDAAMPYLNQIPGAQQPYFQPYINQGKQAGEQLTGQYNQMTQDPGEFYNNLGKGYQQSPGYQFKLQQALQAANNAAAAGGYAGSPQHEQFASQIGNDVANQDYQEYIKHLMDIFGLGQKGQEGFQQQGFDASKEYGNNLGDVLGRQGQLAYEGQKGQNENSSNNFGNFLKFGASLIPGVGPAISGGLNFLPQRSYG